MTSLYSTTETLRNASQSYGAFAGRAMLRYQTVYLAGVPTKCIMTSGTASGGGVAPVAQPTKTSSDNAI